jgi:flagellar motor switch protein FliN/FliY
LSREKDWSNARPGAILDRKKVELMADLESEKGKNNGGSDQVDLSLLMDVPLQVTVELGRARMTIENLLRLNQGSVVELSQVIGEPLAILVNNKLMAHGEAVVVKEKFAVRIVDVVSPERRIENLR